MHNKIHILGAAGAGTSTLGHSLGQVLPHVHLDTDDYFWATKFSEPRPVPERKEVLGKDLVQNEKWILSGSVTGWGDCFMPCFDLVIFLWVPPEVRMARLQQREVERYGNEALVGGSKFAESQTFLEWAALYDHAGTKVRSKALHEQWMAGLSCPVLRIQGVQSVEERVERVMGYLERRAF